MSDGIAEPGPSHQAMIKLICQSWPEADIVTIEGGAFFSLDSEKHWPNFATVVWNDDFDQASNLTRPGFFRVNIGVGREAFQRLVGSVSEPDHTAVNRLLPHPIYANQNWISIVNPSDTTVRDTVLPLIGEAYDRLAARRQRRATQDE
jgi:hypothetical protein